MMRTLRVLAVAAMLGCAGASGPGLAPAPAPSPRFADAIYSGGEILTMEGDAPQYAEALAVRGGRIAFVGALGDAEKLRGPATREVDLHGHALLPGFVDTRGSVFTAGFFAEVANLLPPPDGPGNAVPALTRSLYAWGKGDAAHALGWVMGMGFDESLLRERRPPTRDELDYVSRTVPVIAIHRSRRLAVVNTKGLEALDLARAAPSGRLEGSAFAAALAALPSFDPVEQMAKGQELLASRGITAAQEGRASAGTLAGLAAAADAGKIYLDVASYADAGASPPDALRSRYRAEGYVSHYRIAGWSIALDASSAALDAGALDARLEQAFANGEQVVVECDGAAAIDRFLDAARKAVAAHGPADRRPVVTCAQAARGDQLQALEALGAIAEASAPALVPDPLRDLASRVTLRPRRGKTQVLDPRVSPYTVLREETLFAARRYFQENERGSIAPGKLADFAILDEDPLRAAPERLAGVRVLETVKDGRTVYTRPEP